MFLPILKLRQPMRQQRHLLRKMPKEFIITLAPKDAMAALEQPHNVQIAEQIWHTTKLITTRKQLKIMAFSFLNLLKPKNTISVSEIISEIDFKGGTKYAENSSNTVYLDIEELGGFPFIKTMIIGDFSTKIKRTGCTLSFIFENDSLVLSSDNNNVESNQIKNTPAYYTEIDFELTEEESAKISSEQVLEIQYTFKDKILAFNPIPNQIQ